MNVSGKWQCLSVADLIDMTIRRGMPNSSHFTFPLPNHLNCRKDSVRVHRRKNSVDNMYSYQSRFSLSRWPIYHFKVCQDSRRNATCAMCIHKCTQCYSIALHISYIAYNAHCTVAQSRFLQVQGTLMLLYILLAIATTSMW